MEISPAVPESIVKKYHIKFKDMVDVAQPELIQGLRKVRIHRLLEDIPEDRVRVEVVRAAHPAVPMVIPSRTSSVTTVPSRSPSVRISRS
jgi:hypothetical protein